MERVGCDWGGLRLEGEGEAAAILSLSNGGGEGVILVCAAAALAALPHTSQGARAMLANLSSCIYYY